MSGVVVLVAPVVSFGAVVFRGLGYLPGEPPLPARSYAWAISSDGRFVVGESSSGLGMRSFRWTAAGGMQDLGDFPGGSEESGANAVSADGSVVTGRVFRYENGIPRTEAYRWTAASGMVGLGHLPGNGDAFFSEGRAVSADGSIIGGTGYPGPGPQAVRWTATTGLTPWPGSGSSALSGMTPDGKIMVGTNGGDRAARITDAGVVTALDTTNRFDVSNGTAVSADGAVVAGWGWSAANYPGNVAFRWTMEGGVQLLGDLPGGDVSSIPLAMSADGKVIVGYSNTGAFGSPFFNEAFIWDAEHGMRSLKAVLEQEHGLNLEGWFLSRVNGITPDGMTFVGWGINPQGGTEAFFAQIPEPSGLCVLWLAAVATTRRRR